MNFQHVLLMNRFWFIKLRGLAQAGFWEVLQAFANEKKSPIGYRPFVDMCLRYGQPDQAQLYIPRVGGVIE